MGLLHHATLKALDHLLWCWRGLKIAKKVMWGWVIQTDLVIWPSVVGGYHLPIMCKKWSRSYAKFRSAVRCGFPGIYEKLIVTVRKTFGGGGGYPPADGAQVNTHFLKSLDQWDLRPGHHVQNVT